MHTTGQADFNIPNETSGELVWIHLTDQFLAVALLILCLPCIVLIALVLSLLSGRSPLVAHLRVGKNGHPLWILKFRTMWGGEREGYSKWQWVERIAVHEVLDIKPRLDPRVISRFARLCRTFSLDELPQLAQAAIGQLSLVGPRPLTTIELDRYYGPSQREVLALKPGITGLWQVRGRNHLTYRQRARYDLFLARNYSWKLYTYILLRTVPVVLSGNGAW